MHSAEDQVNHIFLVTRYYHFPVFMCVNALKSWLWCMAWQATLGLDYGFCDLIMWKMSFAKCKSGTNVFFGDGVQYNFCTSTNMWQVANFSLDIDEKAFKLGCASETLYVSDLTKLFLMDILREFLESSTIHGLSYISTSKVRGC